MRVAMYHCKLPEPGRKPGGVEVFVHRLANGLTRRGHEIEVLSYSRAPADAEYEVRPLSPGRAGDSQVMRQYVMPWRFNFEALAGFDVAHWHGDDWFWLRRQLPSVRTFYGSALLEARTAARWRRRLDKSVVFGLELVAGNLADATYGIGPDSELIYGTDGILGLGVDPPAVERSRNDHPVILFVGTWSGRKRGELLHRAFRESVRPRVPDAELWMVSDHCEPAPGVVWHRSPSDEELQRLMAGAWVFCLPSTYEGLGIPYLEAMAHGVAVVATPNHGATMLLERGESGLLVTDAELGEALLRALTDDELRARLDEAGRRRVLDYSWDSVAATYEMSYSLARERFALRGQTRASSAAAER